MQPALSHRKCNDVAKPAGTARLKVLASSIIEGTLALAMTILIECGEAAQAEHSCGDSDLASISGCSSYGRENNSCSSLSRLYSCSVSTADGASCACVFAEGYGSSAGYA
jgi:hypothetical protein